MRIIGRIFAIIGAYLAACYLAGAAFVAVLFNPFGPLAMHDLGAAERISAFLQMLLVTGGIAGVMAAVCAVIPTTALVAYAEWSGRRSLRFHAITGALIGPVTFIVFLATIGHGMAGFSDATWSMFTLLGASIAAGIAGAVGYWLLVGRTAGAWRQVVPAAPTLPARS